MDPLITRHPLKASSSRHGSRIPLRGSGMTKGLGLKPDFTVSACQNPFSLSSSRNCAAISGIHASMVEHISCVEAAVPFEAILALGHDQRSRAMFSQQFEQHGVRGFSVQDDDAFDAALKGVDAGLDLRDHPARNGAVGNQLARLGN